jgi:PIN domain nuclease of toxin-antitoxin system
VILLDTHALIWWAGGDHQRLSAAAREAIDQEIDSVRLPDGTSGLLVSAISCWEDVERWLALLAAHPAVRFLVAQARALAIPLVSADSKIRSYAQG